MRNFTIPTPNRGMNIVSPQSKLRAGQSSKARNVVFTRTGVKRRRGRRAAYKPMNVGNLAISFMKRFYRLATTGSINKFFVKALGDGTGSTGLWRQAAPLATYDWSDDTKAVIGNGTTSQFTQIPLPNTTSNSLYGQHETTTHTVTSGAMQSGFASKNWLYVVPQYDNTDDLDAAYPKNAPIRTDGTNAYLMGLVPPAALVAADTQGEAVADAVASRYIWSHDTAVPNTSALGNAEIAVGGDGTVYVLYYDSTATDLKLATRSTAGTWTTETVDSSGALSATLRIGLALDANDNIYVCYAENDATADLKFAAKYKDGGTTWLIETVDTAGADPGATDTAIAVDSLGNPHIAYGWDLTAGGLEAKYATRLGSGSWSLAVIDTATSVSVGRDISIALDSSDVPHVCYRDTVAQDQRYANRVGGTWATLESVYATGTSGLASRIKIMSTDVPVIVFRGDTGIRYADRTGGTWATTSVAAVTVGANTVFGFDLDSANNPYVFYIDPTTAKPTFAKRVASTWAVSVFDLSYGGSSSGTQFGAYLDADDDVHVSYLDSKGVRYASGTARAYYYKLTAEYDNGVLGESGPSSAFGVALSSDIDASNTHTLDLNTPASGGPPYRYNMTNDVSRIYIYRTVRGGTATSPFYRAGSVACSSGTPSADFTDNVSDSDLVSNVVLDADRFLPPKFRRGVIWKDRAVIANLKARRTNATEGTELDLEANGIHKNRIRFSEAFHPDVYKQNFFQDILPDGDSGSIQQLIVNPKNDSLYVFMENDVVALTDLVGDTVSSLSFRPRNIANSHGTPAPQSVIEYEGFLFYWTKWGIEVIYGSEARNITSDTIGILWNLQDAGHPNYADRVNVGQFAKVRSTVMVDTDGERILWAYPAATQAYNDRILVLDFSRWRDSGFQDDGVFSIWDGWNVGSFARWDGEGDRGEVFGSQALNTLRDAIFRIGFLNEDEAMNAAGDVSILPVADAYIKPGLTDAGTEERLKRFNTVRIDARIKTAANTGACSVTITPDINDTSGMTALDTVTWTQGAVKRVSKNFPHTAIGMYGGVDIKIDDQTPGASGGSPPFELHAISYTVGDVVARTVRG